MADDKSFWDAYNDLRTALHSGANSQGPQVINAWNRMGYNTGSPHTGSAFAASNEPQVLETEIVKDPTEQSVEKSLSGAEDGAELRKSLVEASQSQPVELYVDSESTEGALTKSLAELTLATQAMGYGRTK